MDLLNQLESPPTSNACQDLQVYLEREAPDPNLLEADVDALRLALRGLGGRSLLGLKVPRRWGGRQISELDYFTYQETLARYSGTLAFIQTQHQTAAALIARGQNEFLKQKYLPNLSRGQMLAGVSFSHLRRPGLPLLRAVPEEQHYRLCGSVPWLSGYNVFQRAVVAATLPDERILLALLPFGETSQSLGGTLSFSQPLELAAMNATNTVSAELKDWLLTVDRVVDIRPAGWIAARDQQSILKPTPFALGSGRAGLDILQGAARTGTDAAVTETWARLDQELSDCRQAVLAARVEPPAAEEQVRIRAWSLELAQRCAYAAVIVSRGAANHRQHAAQRLYREAIVFSVSGQTPAVMAATLARLVR